MVRRRRSSSSALPVETSIAVRAYAIPVKYWKSDKQPSDDEPGAASDEVWRWPDVEVIFDTETRTDLTQRLLFGWYQIRRRRALQQEGPIPADDLTVSERAEFDAYIASHRSDHGRPLRPRSRQEFADYVLWGLAWRAEALIVGFNLAFDLSRLANSAHPARGDAYKLRYWRRSHDTRDERANVFRPDIVVKAIDSRRQFIRFQKPQKKDAANLRPDGTAPPGNFLDLHSLAYAFTDRNLTLDGAAEAFECSERKQTTDVRYGVIDERQIDYCRQDVRVTASLLDALHDEYDRHPIEARPRVTQLVSPAALGKTYLAAMGVTPLIERRGSVPRKRLGQAMTAYIGGRVETMIRRVDVPCVYVDATSMYSSVFALTKLWRTVTAAELTCVQATRDARRYLDGVTREGLLDPAAWPALAGVFCRVRPAGHRLPVRAQFGIRVAADADDPIGDGAFQIALTSLDSGWRDLWFALADLVACKILTGDAPEILEAFRVAPSAAQVPLRPVKLRGEVEIDPSAEDFFQRLIEARKRADQSTADGRRTDQFLKTMASAAAYGIFAEVRELPARRKKGAAVDVWAHDYFRVTGVRGRLEEPGRYCFPPVAATVTAAARLMLALLEAEVAAKGGRHIAADTDALIIVASEAGGVVLCPGGDRSINGQPVIHALTWDEVDEIRERLNRLNPYDRLAVPDLFKLEKENFVEGSKQRVDLHALAISPKRYALFEVSPGGDVQLRRTSRHGLGLFLPPHGRPAPDTDEDADVEYWVATVWRRIVDEVRGQPLAAEPAWFSLMAPSRGSLNRWSSLEPYKRINGRRPYRNRVKPANFLLLAHDDPLVVPPAGVERDHLTPIAPFSREPDEWLTLSWRNRWNGDEVRLTTRRNGESGKVRVRTYGDVVTDYRLHPDPKSATTDGSPVRRGTVGLVRPRPVLLTKIRFIGKEGGRLAEEEEGGLRLADEPYLEYVDVGSDWEQCVGELRSLRDSGRVTVVEIARATGHSERTVQYWLNRGDRPRRTAEVIARTSDLRKSRPRPSVPPSLRGDVTRVRRLGVRSKPPR